MTAMGEQVEVSDTQMQFLQKESPDTAEPSAN